MTRLFLKREGKPRKLLLTLTPEGMEEVGSYIRGAIMSPNYEWETDFPKPKTVKNLASLQVDVTAATPSNRTLSVSCTYHLEHGKRVYLATCTRGVIRGTVDDSVEGANKFWSRLKAVWPNAQLEK